MGIIRVAAPHWGAAAPRPYHPHRRRIWARRRPIGRGSAALGRGSAALGRGSAAPLPSAPPHRARRRRAPTIRTAAVFGRAAAPSGAAAPRPYHPHRPIGCGCAAPLPSIRALL
ncbi:MAG: hypothetical protein RMJ55_09700, partial [Roseiflexaceae bacterium]|nr:hypothetical protein [Roseiflexaceae bacterium]